MGQDFAFYHHRHAARGARRPAVEGDGKPALDWDNAGLLVEALGQFHLVARLDPAIAVVPVLMDVLDEVPHLGPQKLVDGRLEFVEPIDDDIGAGTDEINRLVIPLPRLWVGVSTDWNQSRMPWAVSSATALP